MLQEERKVVDDDSIGEMKAYLMEKIQQSQLIDEDIDDNGNSIYSPFYKKEKNNPKSPSLNMDDITIVNAESLEFSINTGVNEDKKEKV